MAKLDFSHGGNIYEAEKKYKKKVIDFSANINPLGLPSRIKRTICKNFETILHYPDPEADITRKIAWYWGIKEGNVLLGNGSIEPVYLVVSAFMPKTALMVAPTFSEYERAIRNVKSRINFAKLYEEENFRLNLSQLGDSDIFFLCNPNNPTGNLLFTDPGMVESLPNKLIVIDEAFLDFLRDEERYTLIWKAVKSKRIIVMRTFTKFFALPGLRIGYIVAHKDIVKTLKRYQMPWNVNCLALKAASTILTDRGYINKTRQFIEKERGFLFNEIAKVKGLRPYPSVANFLLIKIEGKNLSSTLLAKKLIREGLLIRDCANFRGLGNKFIRIAVRSREENLRLLRALKEKV